MTLINEGRKVRITNTTTQPVVVSGSVNSLNGLEISGHDYISMSYSGSNLTSVVYRDGGASGNIIATLTLAYDGNSNLTSVTKS